MSTMNISLSEKLKSFGDDQVMTHGFSTSSEYVRELIRKDQGLLLPVPPRAVIVEYDYLI